MSLRYLLDHNVQRAVRDSLRTQGVDGGANSFSDDHRTGRGPQEVTDFDRLQGLWRFATTRRGGQLVRNLYTHLLIVGNTMKYIDPNWVDSGRGTLRITFSVNEVANPKRLTETLDYNGPDGPPDPNAYIIRYFYRLDGDTLTMCKGELKEFPSDFSDEHEIFVLSRDRGPIPRSRKPSGTPAINDDLVGILPWDDNLGWYSGRVQVHGISLAINITPTEGTDAALGLSRIRRIVADFDRYRELAANYAVKWLLDLKNCEWRQEGEKTVSPEEFKRRISLSGITIDRKGCVSLSYQDDDLFLGHSIRVCLDDQDRCTTADI